MQEKKDVAKNVSQDESDNGMVKISIRDGYQLGDYLSVGVSDVNFTWNEESKELVVPTTVGYDIYSVLSKVYLESTQNTENKEYRFIEVKYISNNGDTFSLEEYNITPYSSKEQNIDSKILEYASLDGIFEDSQSFDDLLSFDFQEMEGADFLDHSIEEVFSQGMNIEETDARFDEVLQNIITNNSDPKI